VNGYPQNAEDVSVLTTPGANAKLTRKIGFDPLWIEALSAILDRHSPEDSVLAPNEFLHFFRRLYPLHIRREMIGSEQIDWFLLHKGMLNRVDPEILNEALSLPPHFANEVFVLFGQRKGELPRDQVHHLHTALAWEQTEGANSRHQYGALVKTFNRPNFLERCIESINTQFDRILIVDDGSRPSERDRNSAIADSAGAEYVCHGRNLGHACALNTGVAMLLANSNIAWISVFDDDTELVPKGFERLRRITSALDAVNRRNLYSGYASPLHFVHEEQIISGETVRMCRSCSAQHMHAHRSYWQAVLPVPTAYDGAPKTGGGIFDGQGSDVDWWCSNWAPHSAIKEGASVYVLPGLVRNCGQGHSTWSGQGI
jgi:hypothetical protein